MPEICFNLEFHRQMFKSQTEVTALQNVFSFFPVSNPYISAVSFLCASKELKNCSNHTKVARFTRFTETNCTFLPDSAVRPYPYSGQVSISYHITVSVKVGQVLQSSWGKPENSINNFTQCIYFTCILYLNVETPQSSYTSRDIISLLACSDRGK